jgi:hypothetical protein
MNRIPALRLPVLSCVLALTSCVATFAGNGEQGSAKKQPAVAAGEVPLAQAKREKKERELKLARLELEVSEKSTAAELLAKQNALQQAELKLMEARTALERFQQASRAHKLDTSTLGIDRASSQLEESQAELAQLKAMYAAEKNLDATGTQTRDLVLARHEKQVEFAKRELELRQRARADLEQGELAKEERKLSHAVAQAEFGLQVSRGELERKQVEVQIALERARGKLLDMERGLSAGEGGAASKGGGGAGKAQAGASEEQEDEDGDEGAEPDVEEETRPHQEQHS